MYRHEIGLSRSKSRSRSLSRGRRSRSVRSLRSSSGKNSRQNQRYSSRSRSNSRGSSPGRRNNGRLNGSKPVLAGKRGPPPRLQRDRSSSRRRSRSVSYSRSPSLRRSLRRSSRSYSRSPRGGIPRPSVAGGPRRASISPSSSSTCSTCSPRGRSRSRSRSISSGGRSGSFPRARSPPGFSAVQTTRKQTIPNKRAASPVLPKPARKDILPKPRNAKPPPPPPSVGGFPTIEDKLRALASGNISLKQPPPGNAPRLARPSPKGRSFSPDDMSNRNRNSAFRTAKMSSQKKINTERSKKPSPPRSFNPSPKPPKRPIPVHTISPSPPPSQPPPPPLAAKPKQRSPVTLPANKPKSQKKAVTSVPLQVSIDNPEAVVPPPPTKTTGKNKSKKRKSPHRPPPEIHHSRSRSSSSEGLASSSSSSGSHDDIPRMSLSERFGKLSQMSANRHQYKNLGTQLKIKKEPGIVTTKSPEIIRRSVEKAISPPVQPRPLFEDGVARSSSLQRSEWRSWRSPVPRRAEPVRSGPATASYDRENRSRPPAYESSTNYKYRNYGTDRGKQNPRDLPLNWDDVRVRYKYYRDRGFFWERDVSLEEYMQWEKWWCEYRDWLESTDGYNRGTRSSRDTAREHEYAWGEYWGKRGGGERPPFRGERPPYTQGNGREHNSVPYWPR